MTLLNWGDSEGTKGRCDARCHNATQLTCNCMCGGRYHGATYRRGGLAQAIEQYHEEVAERIAATPNLAAVPTNAYAQLILQLGDPHGHNRRDASQATA